MIPITSVIPTVMSRIKKLPMGHGIDLRTYKRNRSVLIVRRSNDEFEVIRNGFGKEQFNATAKEIPRLLKGLLKKEFPRSNKVRLYSVGEDGREIPRKI
ncbi:MAG: hypothetical protein HQL69_13140 [Magnetococcales bacterium]|nr:hypothetical protein [Magnetococcales bacterium]